MKLVTNYAGALYDLEAALSITVEPIALETIVALGLVEVAPEDDTPEVYGLWLNYAGSDCVLLWHGTETDCLGRQSYIARKTAALDIARMP